MKDMYLRSLRQYLWHLLAGTKGGMTRIDIINLIRDRPYNANQLRRELDLDYKTVQHHLRIMLKRNIITTQDEKSYGSMYFLSPMIEENMGMLEEILGKIGEKKLSREEKD